MQLRHLTQPEIVLPAQHAGMQRPKAPELRLLAAILQDALDCVEQHRFASDPQNRQIYFEARQWFLADETTWPCSFDSICQSLDLDPNAVRRQLGMSRSDARLAASDGDSRSGDAADVES